MTRDLDYTLEIRHTATWEERFRVTILQRGITSPCHWNVSCPYGVEDGVEPTLTAAKEAVQRAMDRFDAKRKIEEMKQA